MQKSTILCQSPYTINTAMSRWAHTKIPSMIRIHLQPSSPPRGPISASPRARRPGIVRIHPTQLVYMDITTHPQKHPTKTQRYRTNRCAGPSLRVDRSSTDTAPKNVSATMPSRSVNSDSLPCPGVGHLQRPPTARAQRRILRSSGQSPSTW